MIKSIKNNIMKVFKKNKIKITKKTLFQKPKKKKKIKKNYNFSEEKAPLTEVTLLSSPKNLVIA